MYLLLINHLFIYLFFINYLFIVYYIYIYIYILERVDLFYLQAANTVSVMTQMGVPNT